VHFCTTICSRRLAFGLFDFHTRTSWGIVRCPAWSWVASLLYSICCTTDVYRPIQWIEVSGVWAVSSWTSIRFIIHTDGDETCLYHDCDRRCVLLGGTLKMREWKHREVNEYGKRWLTYVCSVDRTNAALIYTLLRQYDFFATAGR